MVIDNKSKHQLIYTLTKCIETYPQYTIAQHLIHILRTKGDSQKDPYFWADSKLLKYVEDYDDELAENLAQDKIEKRNNNGKED